jgi:membrane fusion protein (multidrug efflux system)
MKRADSAKVELLREDGSAYPLPGRIFFSDLAVDPSTGAVLLRAEFPNPRRELLPGMFVRIRFAEAVADNTIRLPQRAVQGGAQGQFVMLVTAEGKAAPQPVRTGGMAGGDFIIAEGLKGGEQVIVNGLQKARPGSPVTPVTWKPQGAPAASPGAIPPAAGPPAPAGKSAGNKEG